MPKPAAERYLGARLPGGLAIVRLIGAGKFAWVFEAQGSRGSAAAVKVLYRDDEQAVRRFHREVKILRELPPNANCVGYLGHGELRDGRPYLAMELVDGFNLSQVLSSGRRIPERAACSLMAQVCDGFRELHKLGLTHRDITPDNIMVTHQGRQVKIMDFGLVQDSQGLLKLFEEVDILDGHDFVDNLDAGLIAGTPEYMAPEQITDPQQGSRPQTDTTADVFALGVVFFQLLTGRQLFPYEVGRQGAGGKQGVINYLRWRQAFQDEDLRCPDAINAELWSILRKALARDPRRRQPTASDLGDDVRYYLETGQGVFEDDLSETIAQEVDPSKLRSLIMTTGEFKHIRSLATAEREAPIDGDTTMDESSPFQPDQPLEFPVHRRPTVTGAAVRDSSRLWLLVALGVAVVAAGVMLAVFLTE